MNRQQEEYVWLLLKKLQITCHIEQLLFPKV